MKRPPIATDHPAPLQPQRQAADTGRRSQRRSLERLTRVRVDTTMPSKESRAERVSTKTREKARPARDGRAHAAEKRAFVPADMRRLEQLLAQHAWPEHSAFVRARKQARRRVLDVLETESSQDVARTALLVACTELLVALHLEGGVSAQEAAELADAVERATGISAS